MCRSCEKETRHRKKCRQCHSMKCCEKMDCVKACKVYAKKVHACKVDIKQDLTVDGNATIKEKLTVEGDVQVDGDLCVDGKIKNVCLDLDKYCPPAPTEDVYEQYDIFNSNMFLEHFEDFVLPVPERLVDPEFPVYGYDESGNVVLDGGKVYNDQFTEFNVKFHSVDLNDTKALDIPQSKVNFENTFNFLAERGIQIPYKDLDENSTFKNILFNSQGPSLISVQFAEDGSYLDLIAVAEFRGAGIGQFGDSTTQRYVPLRIPITEDCLEYTQKLGVEPIAYYNLLLNQLSIDVPDTTEFITVDGNLWLFVPFVEATGNITMNGFHGKFGLYRRNKKNELIRGYFDNLDVLLQISKTINFKTVIDYSPYLYLSDDFTINMYTGGEYTGIIIPKINGGSSSLDINNCGIPSDNAVVQLNDPFIYPETMIGLELFSEGDNPNTVPIETFASPSRMTMFADLSDNPLWGVNFINNPPIPEDMNITPEPTYVNSYSRVMAHEFLHNIQFGVASPFLLNAEGTCVGLEMLTNISNGTLSQYRPPRFCQYVAAMARGLPLGSGRPSPVDEDYGSGLLWNQLFRTADKNLQGFRRALDLLPTYEKSLRDNFTAIINVTFENFSTPSYKGALRLSLQQAYNEILSKDLAEVYRDFMITMSILRNNNSVPEKYRTAFPHWLCSAENPYNADASSDPDYTQWWDNLNENTVNPGLGVEPLQQLGEEEKDVVVEDLSSNVFVLDGTLNEVQIDVTAGTWSATVVQFTQNVPDKNGTFMQLPSVGNTVTLNAGDTHTFDLTALTGAGLKRLILSNLTITDWETVLPTFGSSINIFAPNVLDVNTGVAKVTGLV
jgi:hypothetical protein